MPRVDESGVDARVVQPVTVCLSVGVRVPAVTAVHAATAVTARLGSWLATWQSVSIATRCPRRLAMQTASTERGYL